MSTTEKKQSSHENEDKSYLEIFQNQTHIKIRFFLGKSMYVSVTKESISGPLMFMGFSSKKLQGF